MYSILRIYFEVALNSMGDGPMGDGMAAVKEAAAVTVISSTFVSFLLSVLWLCGAFVAAVYTSSRPRFSRLGLLGILDFKLSVF